MMTTQETLQNLVKKCEGYNTALKQATHEIEQLAWELLDELRQLVGWECMIKECIAQHNESPYEFLKSCEIGYDSDSVVFIKHCDGNEHEVLRIAVNKPLNEQVIEHMSQRCEDDVTKHEEEYKKDIAELQRILNKYNIVNVKNNTYGIGDIQIQQLDNNMKDKVMEEISKNLVKPHFNAGDWVVYDTDEWHDILQIKSCDYTGFTFNDGTTANITESVYMRKWTIDDAKNGDVLEASDGSIFIYSGHDAFGCKYNAALIDGTIEICDKEKGEYWESIEGVTPADDECKKMLFRELKNNGYVWDKDKHTLTKAAKYSINDCVVCRLRDKTKTDGFAEYVGYIRYVFQYGDTYPVFYYRVDGLDGKLLDNGEFIEEQRIKPWTIERAKDGDVLKCKNNQSIILFKMLYKNDIVKYYCEYNEPDDMFIVNEGDEKYYTTYDEEFFPANDAEVDLLMSKMNDMNYVWKKHDKKLDRTKFKPGQSIMMRWHNKTIEKKIEGLCEDGYVVTDGTISFDDDVMWEDASDELKQQRKREHDEDIKKLHKIYNIVTSSADEYVFMTCNRLISDSERIELQEFLNKIKNII